MEKHELIIAQNMEVLQPCTIKNAYAALRDSTCPAGQGVKQMRRGRIGSAPSSKERRTKVNRGKPEIKK